MLPSLPCTLHDLLGVLGQLGSCANWTRYPLYARRKAAPLYYCILHATCIGSGSLSWMPPEQG